MLSPEMIASVASVLTSTILAIVALIFTYRQNVGWAPMALVAESHLEGQGGSTEFSVCFQIEIWNRRKYPVVLRLVKINYSGLNTKFVLINDGPGKHFGDNSNFWRSLHKAIQPNSGEVVKLSFVSGGAAGVIKPDFNIEIHLFDPMQNRTKVLNMRHRFGYPDFGWKVNEEKIKEIEDLTAELHKVNSN